MNKRIIIKCIGLLLAVIIVLAIGNTDLIYIGAALLFFAICIAYADWCERL